MIENQYSAIDLKQVGAKQCAASLWDPVAIKLLAMDQFPDASPLHNIPTICHSERSDICAAEHSLPVGRMGRGNLYHCIPIFHSPKSIGSCGQHHASPPIAYVSFTKYTDSMIAKASRIGPQAMNAPAVMGVCVM